METKNSDTPAPMPVKYRLTDKWRHPHGLVTFYKDVEFEEVPDVLAEESDCRAVRRINSDTSSFHLIPKNLLKPI